MKKSEVKKYFLTFKLWGTVRLGLQTPFDKKAVV
jgi:hypothetical protein